MFGVRTREIDVLLCYMLLGSCALLHYNHFFLLYHYVMTYGEGWVRAVVRHRPSIEREAREWKLLSSEACEAVQSGRYLLSTTLHGVISQKAKNS
jgi:hypothetical protein